jgi:hypothetical protein
MNKKFGVLSHFLQIVKSHWQEKLSLKSPKRQNKDWFRALHRQRPKRRHLCRNFPKNKSLTANARKVLGVSLSAKADTGDFRFNKLQSGDRKKVLIRR